MLSRAQFTQNLVWLLSQSQLVWPDTPNEPVLGRVGVTPAPPSFFLADSVEPFALIRPAAAKGHPEHPDILENPVWTLGIFSANANDQAGGAAVVGGQRTGLGSSSGRGLLEVEPVILDAINAGGIGLSRPRASEIPEPDFAEVAGVTCIGTYKIAAAPRTPLEPCFAPVRRMKAAAGAGHSVVFTFAAPPNRYDMMGLWLVRVAGGVPPSDPTGGVLIPGRSLTTYTDNPGAGTWSYAAFWAYDFTTDPWTGTQAAAPNRWSGFVQRLPGAGFTFVYKAATATVAT